MPIRTLSILIPCYNEGNLIEQILQKIIDTDCGLNKEIIIVNDGSTDNTARIIENFIHLNPGNNVHQIRHEKNKGKGACIQTAIKAATGEVVIIQDGDLEYNPFEYQKMLKPITDGFADVVYGSRFRGSEAHRVLFFLHTIGNKFLTFLSNLFTGLNLTDMETGYKMFKTDIIRNINLKEKRFGFEPEVTAKINKIKNIRIYEVGISYYGRTYQEGKKIRWKDGLRAIYCIFKYNLFSRKK
ncbi:MAG: glycosyltransferase family 2 protein [Chitinophagaceae bacterium]|nr:glycosyltransferase family 2 protein [Chitinophagaceae bacterium]